MAEAAAREEAAALPMQARAHAPRSRRFHRLGVGMFRTAAFRTPGNKLRPEPLDDWHNSLLATFFHSRCCRSPLLPRRLLIAPFSETRLNLDH